MTGLTLPGMIEDPACVTGRLISPSPACGPDESSRRSLQILESFIALRLSDDENDMNAPMSVVASTRSTAVVSGSPLISARCSRTRFAYPGRAVTPVPIAVAPMLMSVSSAAFSRSRLRSSPIVVAKLWNSCPSVIGTASWSWVRPTLSTSWNSWPLARKDRRSRSSSSRSETWMSRRATLIEVG